MTLPVSPQQPLQQSPLVGEPAQGAAHALHLRGDLGRITAAASVLQRELALSDLFLQRASALFSISPGAKVSGHRE